MGVRVRVFARSTTSPTRRFQLRRQLDRRLRVPSLYEAPAARLVMQSLPLGNVLLVAAYVNLNRRRRESNLLPHLRFLPPPLPTLLGFPALPRLLSLLVRRCLLFPRRLLPLELPLLLLLLPLRFRRRVQQPHPNLCPSTLLADHPRRLLRPLLQCRWIAPRKGSRLAGRLLYRQRDVVGGLLRDRPPNSSR